MRFSEFTEEWGTKTLGKIGQVINGLTYSPNDIDERGVLVLRSSNVQSRTITFTDNVFVKANNFNPVKENDILICVRNGSKNLIGKNALVKKQNEGLAFGAFMAIYRSEFNRFLFQWFDTKDYKDIVNKNLGATINSINGGDLKKFKVPFPSLEEQEKIASFLSLIDERILSQKKIISQLKSQMSNLKDLIFEQKLRLKNDNGIYFPSWKFFRLSDLGNTFNGLSGKTKEHFGSGQKYIQYKQIFDSAKINIADCAFVDIEENENQNIVKYGDVFFTISSETPEEIGMSSVLLEKVNNVYLNSFCFGFRSHSFDELIPEFSQFLFRSNGFRNEIVKLAQGSTRYNMSKIEFLKLKVKLPGKDEQIKIASFLSSIQEKIETEKQILEKLELQKKFLLGNLFV
ncbi:restriction endonuclease subunit S [Elizabethkingia ursingii]|uniref:restriction endonuclease subunit S n=1 Tax=Elizabethkingia ursingii TaxID=1756150 RepID=UPI00201270C8|nr:restriction endonuclease subunit S [Elizabethkingia ursingii]MCL1667514.1 restriction endonuclease subunit S [Elizabethkingia ursingii]